MIRLELKLIDLKLRERKALGLGFGRELKP